MTFCPDLAPIGQNVVCCFGHNGSAGWCGAGIAPISTENQNKQIMNINALTIKAQECLQQALSVAQTAGGAAVEPIHILAALIADDTAACSYLLGKVGVDVRTLRNRTNDIIATQPRVSGGEQYFSKDSSRAIQNAVDYASKLGDRYASIEHLLLGVLKERGEASRLLGEYGVTEKELLAAIKELRRGQSVDSPTSEHEFDALGRYAINLNDMARSGKLDPVIGRDDEIRRVLQILSRRTKNNPILVGEPGVGKTAIAEGIAHRIINGEVPENLRSKLIYSLDMGALIAGAKYKGEFEERLKSVVREVVDTNGEVLLFIDEIHTLVGAGKGDGAMDAANILKPALARGELRTIGATTLDEFQKYFEQDKALERRFQKVMVDEPSVEDSVSILRGLRDRYESHHKVRIKDEAIVAAVELSHRYITSRFLPDKAIDLVDEAAAKLRLEMNSVPEDIDVLDNRARSLEIEREAIRRENNNARLEGIDRELAELNATRSELRARWESQKAVLAKIHTEKEAIERFKVEAAEAERRGDYGTVAELRYGKIRDAEARISALEAEQSMTRAEDSLIKEEVDARDIAEVVAKWTGIPVNRMLQSEREKLLRMEQELHRRVVGQDVAIAAVSDAVRRSRAGLSDSRRPIGSFLFIGSTGVGKTELAKALAEFLFNDESMLTRIDMSEYQERHSVSRLIGAPPGYVGYDEGGQLTEAVRRKPYSVVLLDEIEKAHPDVFNILLQVLDDGRLTDNKGRTVDFRNTIVIMTSNLGSSIITEHFADVLAKGGELSDEVVSTTREQVVELMKRTLKPEFMNRIDEIVMFTPLTRQQTLQIVDIQLSAVERMIRQSGLELSVTDAARKWLATEGYDPIYGARPVKRVIQTHVVNNLSRAILAGSIDRTKPITIEATDQGIVFNN